MAEEVVVVDAVPRTVVEDAEDEAATKIPTTPGTVPAGAAPGRTVTTTVGVARDRRPAHLPATAVEKPDTSAAIAPRSRKKKTHHRLRRRARSRRHPSGKKLPQHRLRTFADAPLGPLDVDQDMEESYTK